MTWLVATNCTTTELDRWSENLPWPRRAPSQTLVFYSVLLSTVFSNSDACTFCSEKKTDLVGRRGKNSIESANKNPLRKWDKMDHARDGALRWMERVFILCTFISILLETWPTSPFLSGVYIAIVGGILSGLITLRPPQNMIIFASPLAVLNGFLFLTLWLAKPLYAQTATASTFATQFTVPSNADNGANLLPNIYNPNATNPQNVCPGYVGSNVVRNVYG